MKHVDDPRVSFVIPAYNAERWLSQAIWSCRNQTEKKIEVIVVNDGSTDDTQEIAAWHASEDHRVIVFKRENFGRSAARNFGNAQAQAPIICVLDADDMATRNRAKDTIAAFTLKRCDFLFGSYYAVDSIGGTKAKMICTPFDPNVSRGTKLNYICHSTVAYTKKLASEIKYEEGEWSTLGLDDWKFQWEVHHRGYSIKCVKNPLCYYRITEDGTMATRDEKLVAQAKEKYLAGANA